MNSQPGNASENAMLFLPILAYALLHPLGPNAAAAGYRPGAAARTMVGAADARTGAVRMMASAADADSLSAAIASCMAMRASEIKAELDLRKVTYDDLFEKDELAARLARSRIAGEG